MKRDIPRPYKSPWEYRPSWRAGDEFSGRRWGVLNISHNIFVAEFATEEEAKADIRERKKFHRDAARAARQAAKGRAIKTGPALSSKAEEYISKKRARQFASNIPFPA